MSLATILLAVAQVAAAVLVGWAVGSFSGRWVDDRLVRSSAPPLGPPERVLVSVLSFLGFCVAAMVLHIVTGGAVFGIAPVVPLLALTLVAAAWRDPARRPSRFRAPRAVVVVAAALLALYAAPVVIAGSSIRTGDPPWHLGWSEQLLAGEPVPAGPAPELGRNAYPWGYHALIATLVRLVPGSDPLIAHEAMHLMLIGALPLGAACLARLLNPRAGLAAAWLMGAVGGFGWITSPSSAFVASPTEARYGADLVVASPNSVYELFPPALPREVGLAALAAAAMLLVLALRSRDRRLHVAAGAAIGIVGLVSVPMLVTAVLWTLVAVALGGRGDRARVAAIVLAGALSVFALWAGPVIVDHFRFGGFVDITPQLGVEWPLPTGLASWGILLPLAVGGLALALTQPRIVSRSLVGFVAGSLVMLGLSVARRYLDWGVFANETALHPGRVWPPLHLMGAALGGVAFVTAFGWLRARSRIAAIVASALVLAMGVASPVIAARGITDIIRDERKGFVYGSDELARDSFVRRAASQLGPDDVVAVEGSDELAFLLFQLSGVTLATYDDPRLEGNELRIRFADLARRWDARMAAGGFEPDYVLRRAGTGGARSTALRPALERGVFRDETWEMSDGR